jgi:hypothetical protein
VFLKSAVTVDSIRNLSSSLASDLSPPARRDRAIVAEDHPMKNSFLSRLLPPLLVSVALLLGTFLLLAAPLAVAQLGGENLRGDYGMKSGSQGPPGFYLGDIFYFYRADTVKDLNGDDLLKAPAIDIFGNIILSSYVTKKKILSANYAFTVALPILNAELALPSLDVGSQTWGLADMYIKPLELGWHFKQADAIVGYAFFAPTGRYTAGANDNTGLGMWSNEFSAGTTVYFDQARKWHAAGTGFFEIHTSKQDLDAKTGNVFTLEGGAGRAFLQGYANAGLAYAGQWKVSEDSGRDVNPLVQRKKGSMFALGPELNMPVSKKGICSR